MLRGYDAQWLDIVLRCTGPICVVKRKHPDCPSGIGGGSLVPSRNHLDTTMALDGALNITNCLNPSNILLTGNVPSCATRLPPYRWPRTRREGNLTCQGTGEGRGPFSHCSTSSETPSPSSVGSFVFPASAVKKQYPVRKIHPSHRALWLVPIKIELQVVSSCSIHMHIQRDRDVNKQY